MGVEDKFTQAAAEIPKGQLGLQFNVGVAGLAAQANAVEFLQQARNDGFAAKSGVAVPENKRDTEEKVKREREKQFRRFMEMSLAEQMEEMDRIIHWMRDEAKRLHAEADRLHKEYVDGLPRMAELSALIDKEDKLLEQSKGDQKIDRQAYINFLKAQGKEANDKMSNKDLVDMMEKLRIQHQKEFDEIAAKEEQSNEYRKQADEYDRKADQIHAEKEKIKNLPAEEQQERLKEIWKDIPEQVIDEYKRQYGTLDAVALERQKEIERTQREINTSGESQSKSVAEDEWEGIEIITAPVKAPSPN